MSTICLREIEFDDLPQLNQWRNDKELIDRLGNNFRYITQTVDEQWFQHYLQHRDKNIRLAIIHQESNEYIGNVNLTDIHAINASAEFSIWLGNKNYHRQGIGFIATQMMLEHGFKNLNLHRIYLSVLEYNQPAIRLYQKLGFKIDGKHREAIFKNGNFHDLIAMSIIKHEYKG